MKRIFDEFTDLKISRQRKWQMRKNAAGKCLICGEPAVAIKPGGKAYACADHFIAIRERSRISQGCTSRNIHAHSYRLEQQQNQTT